MYNLKPQLTLAILTLQHTYLGKLLIGINILHTLVNKLSEVE